MLLGEALSFSFNALRANRVRTFLTALGLVIGNASVILVVTISMTSRDYILEQIEGIGSNMVYASATVGAQPGGGQVDADYVKMSDVRAVRQQLDGRIVAATGVETSFDRLVIDGREEDVTVIGSDQYYSPVRNLVVLAGRPLDASDVALSQKVALVTERLAKRLFGGQEPAIGKMHQDPRARLHRHRNVQGEGGELRPLGTGPGNGADSHHGDELLRPRGADRSAVRAGADARGRAAGDHGRAEDPREPPPRRARATWSRI